LKVTWKTVAPLGSWLALYLIPVPGRPQCQPVALFAVFAASITGLIPGIDAGRARSGLIGLTVAGVSGYVESIPTSAALDAQRLLRKHGVA
jgi:citrate:succinate antiporter/L-tartrate/succinate antiporter